MSKTPSFIRRNHGSAVLLSPSAMSNRSELCMDRVTFRVPRRKASHVRLSVMILLPQRLQFDLHICGQIFPVRRFGGLALSFQIDNHRTEICGGKCGPRRNGEQLRRRGPVRNGASGEERRRVGRKNKLPPTFSASGGMAECYYAQFGISNTTIQDALKGGPQVL